MSACQSAAKQANDALAYARSVGVGSCGCACGGACESSSAGSCGCADNGGATGGGPAAKRKSDCKRQGPGCSNAACNAAADQAIAVLDAVADRPEGLPRVTMGRIRLARYSAGFTPATGRLPAGWERRAKVTGAFKPGWSSIVRGGAPPAARSAETGIFESRR